MLEEVVIINPSGYTAEIMGGEKNKSSWVRADRKSSDNEYLFINGPMMPTRELAIAEWNRIFSKAPYQPEVK